MMNDDNIAQNVRLLAEILADETEDLKAHEERIAESFRPVSQELRTLLSRVLGTISGTQLHPNTCCLPHHTNPVHWVYKPNVCKVDNLHVFCKRHNLDVCVICGGDLT